MRLRRTGERTEDESSGWFDRGRGPSGAQSGLQSRPARTDDHSGSWFGRARAKYGLGALLVVAGAALFLFPEPVTSTIGIGLIGVGAIVWLVSWLR